MTDILFKWDDSFLIGIEELDHEHKILIDDINRLHKELTMHDEKSGIEECLGDIYARMQAHFALEEHVMKEYGYKNFEEHKREHEELLGSYTECMVQFLNDTGVSSSNHIEACLKDWVIKHIVTSDKKMGLLLREKESFKTKLRKWI
ncbi:MAG: hemerythrin family protein [Pseudomonadota bacterium]